MRTLATGLSGAMRVKDSQNRVRNLSKVVALGGSYRLFFPMGDVDGVRDMVVAAVAGRQLDFKRLGRSFVVLPEKYYEVSETGRITDKSELRKYAVISRALLDAERREEIARAERDAKTTAEQMGVDIDVVALKQAIREIELRYNGDRDAKPQPIYADENQMVSGVKVEIATEVVVVPLNSNKEPEWGKAVSAAIPLSDRKMSQLSALVSNPDYCDPEKNYIEVSYDYIGTDAKTAGQNAVFQGVSKELSLENKFADGWAANGGTIMARLPKDSEAIKARNMTMSSSTTIKEVIELFNKYVSKHQLILLNLDLEDDLVKAAAKDMVELNIAADAPKVQEKLIAIVEAQRAEGKEEEIEESVHGDVLKAAEAKTLGELAENIESIDAISASDIDEL